MALDGGGGGSTGQNLHALGLLDGKKGAEGGDGLANEKELPELVIEGMKKLPGTVAKLAEAIPIIGALLARIIPVSGGSLVAGLETQGIAGKTINPGQGGTRGGALYNAIAAPLMKNSAITDHTGGVGGKLEGGGGDGGGGGGTSSGGGGDSGGSIAQGNFSEIAAPSNQFEWSQMAMASLGALPRPITPDVGPGADRGMSA